MKRAVTCSVILLSLIAFTACQKESTPPAGTPRKDLINLQAPAVDQENLYLRFIGPCNAPASTGDTLRLHITAVTADSLYFEESYTAGSTIALPEPFRFGAKWSKEHLGLPIPENQQVTAFALLENE